MTLPPMATTTLQPFLSSDCGSGSGSYRARDPVPETVAVGVKAI